ncbi:hypothetical protein K469DRAFT_18899 [Zopfia rhizophila CBS 207.26]|uniref:Uncharacterized protein n=1 Tax=Zopfia rhizophila CBS 207.26 TaxID=1314779 RepID=A0A6A6EX41_9PEZI|nr:hypothetical protein K469DRAFT_18899 [Zopfia rhizophila CBS 207.26]
MVVLSKQLSLFSLSPLLHAVESAWYFDSKSCDVDIQAIIRAGILNAFIMAVDAGEAIGQSPDANAPNYPLWMFADTETRETSGLRALKMLIFGHNLV